MFLILKRRLLTTAVQRAGWGMEKASYKRKAASFVERGMGRREAKTKSAKPDRAFIEKEDGKKG